MTHAPDTDPRDDLTFGQLAFNYVAFLATGAGIAAALMVFAGVHAVRTMLFYCGGGCLLAATGKPRWLSATLRSVGEYAFLPNPLVTILFLVFGALAVWLAVVTPDAEFARQARP